MVKTETIELARTHSQSVLIALHPGTVDSALSAPFRGAQIGRPASDAARQLLTVLDGLKPEEAAAFGPTIAIVGPVNRCPGRRWVSEYVPETPLGWHRDVPNFEVICEASLGAWSSGMAGKCWDKFVLPRKQRRNSALLAEAQQVR